MKVDLVVIPILHAIRRSSDPFYLMMIEQVDMSDENQHVVGPREARPPRVAPGRSCIACRKRKIKCDRNHPCAYCVKIHVQCVYPVEENEPRKLHDDNDVLARLKRIEKSLARLETSRSAESESLSRLQQRGRDAPEENQNPNQDGGGEMQSTPGGSGKLVVEAGDTRYVNGSFWADLEDVAADDDEDPSNTTGTVEDATNLSPSPRPATGSSHSYQRFIFGMTTVPQASGLRHLHPPEARIFSLWQIYLENVDPLLKLLHVPTTQRQVLRASSHLDNIPPPVEALMFAIYYAAVTSLQCSGVTQTLLQQEKPDLLDQYRTGFEQSLANANFMTAPDVATLQALTLYLICARQTIDKAFVWSMVGLLYRLATKLGLHRDPASLGLPPFMTEMRRRLWWQICILDVRIAEDNDTDPLICEHNFDTKYPSNVNDGDLDLNMTEPPRSNHNRTEMLFCLTRFDISYAARKLVFSPKFSTDNGYPSLTLAEKSDIIDKLLKDLEENHFRCCDLEVPICFLAITASRLVLAKMKLMIHHPARSQSSGLSQEQFTGLVASSVEIIEYAHELRTNVKYSRWLWLFQQYVEWDAVAFLLHSLTVSPLAPHLADRAWKAIDGFLEDWKNHVPNGLRERRWRRLLALQVKARAKQGLGLEHDDHIQRQNEVAVLAVAGEDVSANANQQSLNAVVQIPAQALLGNNGMPAAIHGWAAQQGGPPHVAIPLSQASHSQQTTALTDTDHNLSTTAGASLDGYFADWGFENASYPMPAAGNWEMPIDEDWGSSWF